MLTREYRVTCDECRTSTYPAPDQPGMADQVDVQEEAEAHGWLAATCPACVAKASTDNALLWVRAGLSRMLPALTFQLERQSRPDGRVGVLVRTQVSMLLLGHLDGPQASALMIVHGTPQTEPDLWEVERLRVAQALVSGLVDDFKAMVTGLVDDFKPMVTGSGHIHSSTAQAGTEEGQQ